MEISLDKDFTKPKTKTSWTPLLRQIFVCSGLSINYFIYGVFFGAPTVLIPQIRNQSYSDQTFNKFNMTTVTVSWLYSISSFGSMPWAIIFPIIAEKYGRKVPYVILWISGIVSISLFYFSTSVIELYVSGVLQGMFLACNITVSIMVLTEYMTPKYRGVLITFKSATFFWGIWISNAIGTFYHWKNIGIFIFICWIYTISPIFWPESPVWLATKGRFEECAKSHRWLKGNGKDSEVELQQLLLIQKENFRLKEECQLDNRKNLFSKFYNSIINKTFYLPQLYAQTVLLLYYSSGKLACTGYIIDIIKSISENETAAYRGMLVIDGVTVIGMYFGVILTKFLKRRTLLLGSASIGVMFLFILSTYLYLIHFNIISENEYLTLSLLLAFSITISCGPMLMCKGIACELTPIKYRSLFLSVNAILCNVFMGISLTIFPYILKYFDSHGTFLFYGLLSSIFIYIVYKVLPETKDKTIIEIEKYFSYDINVVKEEEKCINPEETKLV